MPRSIWPWAGHRRGKAEYTQFATGLAETVDFELFEPREFIAQGDKVAVLLFERFRIRSTAIALDNDYMHVFTIKHGKIERFLIFEDTAPIIASMQDYSE